MDNITDIDVVPSIIDAAADVVSMLKDKNADYGDENLTRHGQLGIIVRCDDKLSRLKNLNTKAVNAVGESSESEWLDIAGYAIQAVRLIREGRM